MQVRCVLGMLTNRWYFTKVKSIVKRVTRHIYLNFALVCDLDL